MSDNRHMHEWFVSDQGQSLCRTCGIRQSAEANVARKQTPSPEPDNLDLFRILTSQHQDEQRDAALATAAQASFAMYTAYMDAGFTSSQSFELVREILIARMMGVWEKADE